MISLLTIGFTQRSAEDFFETIRSHSVKTVIDTRISNNSQLAGFSKKNDLKYFLKSICQVEYTHSLELAPTKELLDAYKQKKISWDLYAAEYTKLIRKREIEKRIPQELLAGGCLLCSERQPHHCHRKLAADFLKEHLDVPIKITHL